MRIGKLTIQYQAAPDERERCAPQPGCLFFRCNICGQSCAAQASELNREVASCDNCGSTVRWRSVIHLLSVELFGKSLALADFPVRPDISGIGMSDWDGYASVLTSKFNYKNTFYHQEPRLDITSIDPALEGSLDFIISSEVFEHIPPPASIAFQNARRLLKPNGVLIFSVPYSKEEKTTEHFPELHDYQLIESDGHYALRNITQSGRVQIFENLVFHGGPGSTLEMRVFSERSLLEEFKRAGFTSVKIYKNPDFEHGIYWSDEWSLPMSARIEVS